MTRIAPFFVPESEPRGAGVGFFIYTVSHCLQHRRRSRAACEPCEGSGAQEVGLAALAALLGLPIAAP